MPTLTAWAHLPNASLIDALIAALPTCPSAARDAARHIASEDAWGIAEHRVRELIRGVGLGSTYIRICTTVETTTANILADFVWDAAWTAGALVAWDDMPAFIALSDHELEALRKVGAGTDVAYKALCAQVYNILTAHVR